MLLEEVKKRFAEEVNRRADDDKYIDKNEELEILQIAIQQGIGAEAARGALVQVCSTQGYVVESQVLASVKKIIETFAENDGVISQKEFNDAVTILKKECQGKRTERQCKRMVIQVIEDNNYKAKQGLFNRWYNAARKEVGL